MEIVIHGRQTTVTDTLRARAEESVRRLAERLRRPVDADIRFDADGASQIVEIVLHAPRYRNLVARAEARYAPVALSEAIAKLDQQIRKIRSARKRQVHGVELRA